MIQEEAKQAQNNLEKKVDSLELGINAVKRLKVVELLAKELEFHGVGVVYTYVLNNIREELERLYETGKY